MAGENVTRRKDMARCRFGADCGFGAPEPAGAADRLAGIKERDPKLSLHLALRRAAVVP